MVAQMNAEGFDHCSSDIERAKRPAPKASATSDGDAGGCDCGHFEIAPSVGACDWVYPALAPPLAGAIRGHRISPVGYFRPVAKTERRRESYAKRYACHAR